MKRLINTSRQPQMLDDGTSLAASGTEGSERLVENITEGDERRLVNRGKVLILDGENVASAVTPITPAASPAGESVNSELAKSEQRRAK